jgi:hypothetical protein
VDEIWRAAPYAATSRYLKQREVLELLLFFRFGNLRHTQLHGDPQCRSIPTSKVL